MSVASSREAQSLVVNGTRIDLIEKGSGPPLLFLHAENGIEPAAAAIDELAKRARVIAPTHPGYGRSELPKGMRSVDDLSYFYLDLLDQLDLKRSHRGRHGLRRLDRRRDRGEDHRADGAAGDGQCRRRQGRRPRDPRHRRYLCADRAGIYRHRLLRSGSRQTRLQGAARCRGARRRAGARGDGAVCLESVLPQSAAEKPAAPHPHPDAVSVGHATTACSARLTAAPIAP